MLCPNCATDNSDDSNFCIGCGNPLPKASDNAVEVACPSCGGTNKPDNLYCIKCGFSLEKLKKVNCSVCGTENDVSAKICVCCGVSFDESQPIPQKNEPIKKSVDEKEKKSESGVTDESDSPIKKEDKKEKKSVTYTDKSSKKSRAIPVMAVVVFLLLVTGIVTCLAATGVIKLPGSEQTSSQTGENVPEIPDKYIVQGVTPPDRIVSNGTVVVNAKSGISLKSEPFDYSSNAFNGKLEKGEKLKYVGESNEESNWIYVYCNNGGYYGWVKISSVVDEADYEEETTKAETTTKETTTQKTDGNGAIYPEFTNVSGTYEVYGTGSHLLIRSGPGKNYETLASITDGTLIEYRGYNKGTASKWIYVYCSSEDKTGWVNKEYVREYNEYDDGGSSGSEIYLSLFDNVNSNYWLDEYWLDDFSRSELVTLFSGMGREEVQYVINGMLARHGYESKSGSAIGWSNTPGCPDFSTKSWYNASTNDMEYIENNVFNSCEYHNYKYLGKIRSQLRDYGEITNYYPDLSDD